MKLIFRCCRRFTPLCDTRSDDTVLR